jgi:quercetin dioxygenase-like cupin family protein/quinol monooxygenase YgiN
MNTIRILAVAVLIACSGLIAQRLQAQQTGSKRTDLQRHDLSVTGREVVQVRVDFEPGYVAPRHTHPGEEIIYVLEGTLEYRIEGQPAVTVKPGDVLFVPTGTIHSVKNIGSTNGAELSTYIVEKGKPLITLVEPVTKAVQNKEVKEMIISAIQFTFDSGDADQAEMLLTEIRDASLKEPGVARFDVARGSDDPSVFVLWEAYRDQDAVDAHKASEHFDRLVLNGIRPLAKHRTAVTAVLVGEG